MIGRHLSNQKQPRNLLFIRLYWADQTKIESSNVDGAVQETLVDTKLSLVTGLAVFGPDLYWVDSGGNVLEGANKEDGSGRRTIQSRLKNLRDLVSVTSVDNEMLGEFLISSETFAVLPISEF